MLDRLEQSPASVHAAAAAPARLPSVVQSYAVAGIAVCVLAYVAIMFFGYTIARERILDSAQATAHTLTRIFVNNVWPDIKPLLPPPSLRDPAALRSAPGMSLIDAMVRGFCRNTDILKVKIYDLNGLTVYSSEPAQIGEDRALYPGVVAALRGQITGQIVTRDKFPTFDGHILNRDMVASYVPIVGDSETVEAVAELYIDRTEITGKANRTLIVFGGGLAVAIAAIYFVSVLIVRRGESDLRRTMSDLRQAKDTAEKASRIKSMFLANMSHELRTPLNAILGFSELIEIGGRGPLNESKHVEYLAHIRNSGNYLLELISDLLDLSAIEAGEMSLRKSPLVLADLAADALRTVQPLAVANGLSLSSDVPADLPPLKADPRRLKQILLNLLSNAIKYTPRDGTVTLRAARNDGGWLRLAIQDSGIGMTEDEIGRTFQPFQHMDNAMTRQRQGTGLGLPLTRKLVEMHGGELAIQSAPGRGTTVSVRLPPG